MTLQIHESNRIRIGDKISIVRRGDRGIWTAEFHHGGQHRHRSLKTGVEKIARQRAITLEGELARGDYAGAPKQIAIADAIDAFLSAKTAEERSPKTLTKYRYELNSWREFLNDRNVRTLSQITGTIFDEYRSEKRNTRSAKTQYTGLVVVKSFAKWCISRELMSKNPLAICKVTKPPIHNKTSATLEQINLILQRATGVCRAQYAVLSFTGIRAGELQHLRPQDVDLANNWIRIRTHAGWKPKTGRDRRVPIHPRLAEILKAQPRSEGVYVFCAPPRSKNSRQHQPINLRRLNTEFQELAKSLGFAVGRKTNGLVIHSLRHFFETQVVDSNIPQFVVDAWMGHVGYETTGRIYYDLRDAKSIEYMQRVKF